MQPITIVGSCLTCGDRGMGYLHASNIVPKQKQSLSTQQQPHYNEKAFTTAVAAGDGTYAGHDLMQRQR